MLVVRATLATAIYEENVTKAVFGSRGWARILVGFPVGNPNEFAMLQVCPSFVVNLALDPRVQTRWESAGLIEIQSAHQAPSTTTQLAPPSVERWTPESEPE